MRDGRRISTWDHTVCSVDLLLCCLFIKSSIKFFRRRVRFPRSHLKPVEMAASGSGTPAG